MSVRTEIVTCEVCLGYGTIKHSELEDYHKGEYKEWEELCSSCKGSGRMKKTTTITYEAYSNPEIAKLTFNKLKD